MIILYIIYNDNMGGQGAKGLVATGGDYEGCNELIRVLLTRDCESV